nr:polyprotein [Pinus nigra virus 1]
MASKFLRSFSTIDKRSISEVENRSVESDLNEHEQVEDPESWNPPALDTKEIYSVPMMFKLSKKYYFKEVEVKIRIKGPHVQIIGLNIFSEDEIKKFRKYAKEGRFHYLHFGAIRIGLAPLFRHGLNTPCIAELFDSRHNDYNHARIGTILGNLMSGCQYGTIYPDYAISLTDVHLKECWKALIGVQGLSMADESEFLSVIVQTSFQLTNTVHPKLKQPVLKDCVTVGIGNAQIEGVHYDKETLPDHWYIQYKSLASDNATSKVKRLALEDGGVKIIPNQSIHPRIPKPIVLPEKHVLPIESTVQSGRKSFYKQLSIPEEPSTSSGTPRSENQLYIPEEKPFLAVNKMFRTHVHNYPPMEEYQFFNRRFVKGGKWPPKTKFCVSSSMSKQPSTRADCAPLLEHNSQDINDMDQVYQVGNYLTTWCSHAEEVLDDLGQQAELINANLKLLYEEQQEEKREREERRKRKMKKKAKKVPKFHVDMSAPNYWDLEEEEEREAAETSAGEGTSRDTGKLTSESSKTFKAEKPFESKKEVMTLEQAAIKFPSFIMPSIKNQNKAHILKETVKYPRIEEDLFASNSSGYILDLDNSSNPGESIRIWIGALYQMQVTTKLDNISIMILAEKRMAGIVFDWWMGGTEEERLAVMEAGLATLEMLLKTQFMPEPKDEKKQLLTDLSRMELRDLKYLDQFGKDFMAKVFKANLFNDLAQKVSYLSKLPGNLGDLIMKDLEVQMKSLDQVYWVDLLFRVSEKVKYLCWQKKAHDITPSSDVCKTVLPWTPFKSKKKKYKRYGRYKPKRVANPKKPFRKYRFLKKRNAPRNNNCCFICKKEGHFARKCPQKSSSKLKACVDIEEFQDDWSVVESDEEVSDVYILTEASDNEEENHVQKMNICSNCSDDDFSSERHYSEIESSSTIDPSSETEDDSDDESEESELSEIPDRGKQPAKILPQFNSLCPFEKKIAPSTSIPQPEVTRNEQNTLLKKIVKTDSLIYIPVQVQVKNEWVSVDAFVDTGGSNNLARPSLFKPLWKPLKNILVSETIGGSVQLTHYVDNISLKVGGSIVKISAIQHYDPSASLMLGMPFINSVLPVTISQDKLIINMKKKAISVPRLSIANSEARRENSQKKAGTRRPSKDSDDWQEVLQIYEARIEKTNKQSACIDTNWSIEQKDIYQRLLKSCSDNPQQFWETESPMQEIVTLHDNGVKGKMIPCTPADEQEMRNQIQELLKMQLIEPSESHYACSAFLVRNHSEIVRGKPRMVINYKPLNAITQNFNYPLPRPEVIMQKIQHSKVFSKFDMKSGYYQIQIQPEDRHKTAFICPAGFYQWKVVPFGLKNAPAFFQRRMDYIFAKYGFIVTYIDDILIHSPDVQNHLKHLEIFLEEVKKHGIVLSERKMSLFQDNIDFLGINVANGSIQMQPHVLTKLTQFPDKLKDKKEIQRFIGVLNYLHKYIPNLSEKTAPIRRHNNGGWSDEATAAVKKLKEECQHLPKLQPPGDGLLILQTDASLDFWSAVLLEQRRNNEGEIEENLCGYASGEFTESQKNYFIAEKETLAIFNGIQRFEVYLTPVKFLIRTDSKNFKYFLSAKISRQLAKGRILAWQIWFQQFDFEVEWIPGNSNVLTDVLTRDMSKMYITCKYSIFEIPGKSPADDSFATFVDRFRILENYATALTDEIKKVVGLRLRRNWWIRRCQAWQSKNLGISLGLDENLVRVYSLPNMKVKLYFRSLSNLWSSMYTPKMIWTLRILNYYQIIGGVDFAFTLFTGAKVLDLEEIPIEEPMIKYLVSLKIPDIFEEIESAYLQRIDENYANTDSFPQYEIFENFADWKIQGGECRKTQVTRVSQCIQRTVQYLKTYAYAWDFHSLRMRDNIEPNPFSQVFSHEKIGTIETDNNQEVIKQHAEWFHEFGNLRLVEKIQILRKMDDLQGHPKALKFAINQKALITISVLNSNWNNNVIHIISLMISKRICTSIIFELGWQNKDCLNENCRLWIQHAIESSTNMFQIFKWELLDGIELQVQRSPATRNAFKDSFLDIEVSALPFLNKWEKQEMMYTAQQPGLHKIKTNIKKGESSSTASNRAIMPPKEKEEMTDAQDPNEGIEEQYDRLMNRYHKQLIDEYETSTGSSEEDLWETRSPMGKW